MAELSDEIVHASLLDDVLPLHPELRRRLEQGIKVLDLGCGRGKALQTLAAEFPQSSFTGYDISEEAIEHLNKRAREKHLPNLKAVYQDATTMEDREAFDCIITLDAIHDQAQPREVLRRIRRALKPGGVYLMQDIDAQTEVQGNLEHPLGPWLYTISCMHCMTVSLAEGGEGLGTMWGVQQALELLKEAGFAATEVRRIEKDIFNVYFLCQV